MHVVHIEGLDVSLVQGLPREMSEAMLAVVLAWASVDGAVSQLYVAIHGRNDVLHSDEASDMPTHTKLRLIQLRIRPSAPDLSKAIGRLKKQYERYSRIRDTIAHCHYAGLLASEPQRAVFFRYRREGDGLAVDALHIAQFRMAARFGQHLKAVALNLRERIGAG